MAVETAQSGVGLETQAGHRRAGTWLWIAAAIVALTLCVFAWRIGPLAHHPLPRSLEAATYVRVRKDILLEAAGREPRSEVLLVGDSISERSGVHRLCGRDVFDAGVSWAGLGDIEHFGPKIAAVSKASLIFVAIGTNDARAAGARPAKEWADHYIAMIRAFPQGTRAILVPAPTIEADKPAARTFSSSRLAELNEQLPHIAKATGASLVARPAVETSDGIHPSLSGAAAWRANLELGCPT